MRPDQRVVVRTPVAELWDASGSVPGTRGPALGAADIAALLRAGPVRFVAAEPGAPLRWVSAAEAHEFWKREVKPRLVSAAAAEAGFRLEDFSGEYAYVATEWRTESGPPVVLLERHH